MKKMVSLCLVLCVAVLSLVSGCATKTEQTSQTNSTSQTESANKSVIQLWSGYCMIAEDELEMEKSEWILTKLVDEYNGMQNDVTVEFTYFDDDDVMLQTLNSSVAANKDIPDIVVLQSGVYLEDSKEMFAPINEYITSDYKESTRYWETATFDNEIYGYPTTGASVTFFAYNKKLIKQAGLDFENNPPKTLNEFLSACDIIKSAGIVPITAGDYECNDFFSTLLSKWWMQKTTFDEMKKHRSGELSFASDSAFIDTCELAQTMWSSGYIVDDYVTNEDTIGDLANGKAAMYNSFTFELGLLEDAMGDNLGILLVPDIDEQCNYKGLNLGSCNQCMSITKASENKKECAEFIEWLLNKDNSIKLYKKYKGLPIRKDVSLQELGWDNNKYYSILYPCVENIATYPDYMIIGKGSLSDAYYKYGSLLVTKKITPSEYAKHLDEAK